ncbi:FISUMP domain-containing protein [Pontibacter vulgaris]|uniref:FISUMP domain-containing protein n=1 Tax=Pontibacter vulgaris TaxID=2905679 RepID=UPI001FA7572A|nr:FISUMP domain-containing protein [Pontibacter vulgaris]
MRKLKNLISSLLLGAMVAFTFSSCDKEDAKPSNPTDPTSPTDDEVIETPFTAIPAKFVGTWYIDHNQGPLSANWEQGTFQGEQGFREFRTIVMTADGKNAVEYTSDVTNVGDEVKQYIYKMTGTLEHQANPNTITFHAKSGKMRVFSNKYTGYKESDIITKDVKVYKTVFINPEASTYTNSPNFMTAKRLDGNMQQSVRFKKVEGGTSTPTSPGGLYSQPPATGTYVQIGDKYYPTVTIGNLEWMSVNYAGPGGLNDADNPEYGTFLKYEDVTDIQVPAGWRLPTRQDYLALLKSQGIVYNEIWDSTDGSDLQSKRLLGQLMSATGWLKQDGYANNKSGFNAVPGNLMVTSGNPQGKGTNCLLWTANKDTEDNPIVFKIIQLPSDTYASFSGQPIGYNPPHVPVRFVKNK